jgi:hypothetical protein
MQEQEQQRRAEWLAQLKPGDEVIVSGASIYLATVLRRTPSGRIIIGDETFERVYNRDGTERKHHRNRLEMPTPERKYQLEKRDLIRALANTPMSRWNDLSLDSLRIIKKMRDEAQPLEGRIVVEGRAVSDATIAAVLVNLHQATSLSDDEIAKRLAHTAMSEWTITVARHMRDHGIIELRPEGVRKVGP